MKWFREHSDTRREKNSILMNRTPLPDMPEPLPFRIHRYLRGARRFIKTESAQRPAKVKAYVRMPKIELPKPPLGTKLTDALEARASGRDINTKKSISIDELGALFGYALGARNEGSRNYPSGGALFPIETYVIVRRVDGIESGAFHYNPLTHTLEHLWSLSGDAELHKSESAGAWANDAAVTIVMTVLWYRNFYKYRDFGYTLALQETGHMGQNILLCAAALDIVACPLSGFEDDVAAKLLDLDDAIEQPAYVIALGKA